jgi:hypothetical protein
MPRGCKGSPIEAWWEGMSSHFGRAVMRTSRLILSSGRHHNPPRFNRPPVVAKYINLLFLKLDSLIITLVPCRCRRLMAATRMTWTDAGRILGRSKKPDLQT